MTTPIKKDIYYVDASALSDSSCDLRLYYKVVKGYRSKRTSNDIEYGSAFHHFKKVLTQKADKFLAMMEGQKYFLDREPVMEVKPKKQWLNVMHLNSTMTKYLATFGDKREKDNFKTAIDSVTGEPMVEVQFAIPWYVTECTEILLSGTIDEIGYFPGGCAAIGDEKTTSMWDIKGFFESFKLKPQLRVYLLALERLAQMFPNGPIAELWSRGVGVFINGVFLKSPSQGDALNTHFERSPVMYFKEEDLNEFKVLLNRKVQKLVYYIEENITPLREGILNGACETPYGKCPFFSACSSPNPQGVLAAHFITRQYNPLKFHDSPDNPE